MTRKEAAERISEDLRYNRTCLSPRYIEALELAADELSKEVPAYVRRPRGRWVRKAFYEYATCSECGERALALSLVDEFGPEVLSEYCPHCGAHMENWEE